MSLSGEILRIAETIEKSAGGVNAYENIASQFASGIAAIKDAANAPSEAHGQALVRKGVEDCQKALQRMLITAGAKNASASDFEQLAEALTDHIL